MIMKPDDLATAGVLELLSLSEVDEEAPPEAAGDDDPARKSSKSSLVLLDMLRAKSRFLSGIEIDEDELDVDEEVGEGGC